MPPSPGRHRAKRLSDRRREPANAGSVGVASGPSRTIRSVLRRGTQVVFECGACGQMTVFPGAWPANIEKGELVAARPEFVPVCGHLVDLDDFALHRDSPEAMRRAAEHAEPHAP